MTISDAVTAELPYLRAQAEALMLDAFNVFSPKAEPDVDADGMEIPGYEPVEPTRGKITGGSRQSSDTAARTVNVGGVDRTVIEGGLHIPVGSSAPAFGGLGVGWEYVLTALGPSTPAELLGSRWLVLASPAKSYMTARRLDVVRLS